MHAFKVGQKVRVVEGRGTDLFEDGEILEIILIVHDGQDWHRFNEGRCSGIVVRYPEVNSKRDPRNSYPYVWDFDRFEVVKDAPVGCVPGWQ